MTLIHWEPFPEIDSLQRGMNKLFEDLSSPTQSSNRKAYFPPVEMTETPEEIHVKLEITGMDTSDIDIQVSVEVVMIAGERKSMSRTNAEAKKRSEFRYGGFHRVIPLPARVENTNVNAKYRDGILHLTLSKDESEKPKSVKINVS